jgi:hypothetical protein
MAPKQDEREFLISQIGEFFEMFIERTNENSVYLPAFEEILVDSTAGIAVVNLVFMRSFEIVRQESGNPYDRLYRHTSASTYRTDHA